MKQQLKITISSYWHAGTGRTSGNHVDRLVEKDQNDLPFLNGRHLKGLIRDAVQRAEAWNWYDNTFEHTHSSLSEWWFGSQSSTVSTNTMARFETFPGVIAVSNATLLDHEIAALNENPALKTGLYTSLFSTAIDHQTGTAKDQSLRGIEVAVPMTLVAEIECSDEKAKDIFTAISKAVSLIDHVGGQRNRGLGRCEMTLQTEGVHS